MNGWFNKRLRVDLTSGAIIREYIGEDLLRSYIGGRGLNDWVIYNEVPNDCDPLMPENVICFAPGPLTGSLMPMNSRCHVSTIGPHSNILADGNGGSLFPYRMKLSGFDQIVITGASKTPVYLWTDGDRVNLLPAEELWGLDTWQCTDVLKKLHGDDIGVACIGQAGENLVRFASVIFDKYSSAARGAGAVMGSKNFKAIAVRGDQNLSISSEEELKELAKEDRSFFMNNSFQKDVVKTIGTHHGIANWLPGWHNNEKYLTADEVPPQIRADSWKEFEIKRTACHTCPCFCKDVYQIPSGTHSGEIGSAMEYEGIHCLGINCGITEPVPIMVMQNLADKYGMCVIPLGNCIAIAKDLYSRGYLDKSDTYGLDLSWDNWEDQIELIHLTAQMKDFGAIIGAGELGMNKLLGKHCNDYNDQVKGSGRGNFPPGIFALAHATSTRGADHLRGRSWAFGENDGELFPWLVSKGYLPSDEIERLIVSENACALNDSIGRCKGSVNAWVNAVPLIWKYPLYEGLAKILNAATGFDFSEEELKKIGNDIYMLELKINKNRGSKREDDRLVQRPNVRNSPEGLSERLEFEKMLDKYYSLRNFHY